MRLGYPKRGPLSDVKSRFPSIVITEGTTEEDDLWARTGGAESELEAGERVASAFEQVWNMAENDNCTSHPSPLHRPELTAGIAIVSHKETFNTLWPRVFKLEGPKFQTAEMRVMIVKQSL